MLDADVLIPILSCDVLLSCFEAGLFLPIVTPKILAEVERNLAVDFPHLDSAVLLRRAGFMATALALNTHADMADRHGAVVSVNAKDRHVVAIGLRLKADVVVTNDRRLRREINGLGHVLRAVTGDTFVASLADQNVYGLIAVIDTLVAKRTRPAMDRGAFLERLQPVFPIATEKLRQVQS